jgi:hypothetical protein
MRLLTPHKGWLFWLATNMKKEFPDYPLEMLLDYNIPAVAKELGVELAPAKLAK